MALDRFLFLSRVRKWRHVAWVRFVEYVYGSLWSLTIIGGFIKHYSYYMIPFILAENPTLKANETIRLSRMMMKGHKWECCKLELSFLGWDMLSVLTLGLTGIFYSAPYKACAMAEYYVYVRQCSLEADLSYQNFLRIPICIDRPYHRFYNRPIRKVFACIKSQSHWVGYGAFW